MIILIFSQKAAKLEPVPDQPTVGLQTEGLQSREGPSNTEPSEPEPSQGLQSAELQSTAAVGPVEPALPENQHEVELGSTPPRLNIDLEEQSQEEDVEEEENIGVSRRSKRRRLDSPALSPNSSPGVSTDCSRSLPALPSKPPKKSGKPALGNPRNKPTLAPSPGLRQGVVDFNLVVITITLYKFILSDCSYNCI